MGRSKAKTLNNSGNKDVNHPGNICGKGIDDVCSFKRLEQIIEDKAEKAVRDVDGRLKAIGFCVSILLLFGIPYLAKWYCNKVDSVVTVRFVEGKLNDRINETVPSMIDDRFSEFERKMTTIEHRIESNMTMKVRNAEGAFKIETEKLMNDLSVANGKIEIFGRITAAQAGDRDSYEYLVRVSLSTNELGRMANDALKMIRAKYLSRKMSMNRGLFYSLDISADKLKGLAKEYHWTAMAYGDCEWNSEGAIIELIRTRDRRNVATLVHVVEKSKHLDSIYAAICGIEILTGEAFEPLGINQVLLWWKDNCDKEEFHNGFEKFFGLIEADKTGLISGETGKQHIWENIIALDKIIRENPEVYPAALLLLSKALCIKMDAEQDELRKKMIVNAMTIVEKNKDVCAQWDAYKTMVLFLIGDGNDAVRFVHSRLKEDPSFKGRLDVYSSYGEGFWKAYEADVKKMGLE